MTVIVKLGRSHFAMMLITAGLLCAMASCGMKPEGPGMKPASELTPYRLWQIHEETRFVRFYYQDGRQESGLLLRWQPDSILVQERGNEKLRKLPVLGISRMETVVGNRIMEGIAAGALLAGGYFAAVGGTKLNDITFGTALAKLLVPPAIVIAGIAVGSSMELKERYDVPENFRFDYEAARMEFSRLK